MHYHSLSSVHRRSSGVTPGGGEMGRGRGQWHFKRAVETLSSPRRLQLPAFSSFQWRHLNFLKLLNRLDVFSVQFGYYFGAVSYLINISVVHFSVWTIQCPRVFVKSWGRETQMRYSAASARLPSARPLGCSWSFRIFLLCIFVSGSSLITLHQAAVCMLEFNNYDIDIL